MSILLTLIGYGIAIFASVLAIWNSNIRYKRKQADENLKFQTSTNIKIVGFEKELIAIKAQVNFDKEEIIRSYQSYKDETILSTKEFRTETKEALKENKSEHNDIKLVLAKVSEDLSFIKGKLSTPKERRENEN